MHLATRGNNKILRTPPPHISSSEEILLRLTRRTHAQFRTYNHPFSNQTYTKSTPNRIHTHYAPSVTLTHTRHTLSLQLHRHTHHNLWTDPAGVTELLASGTEKLSSGPQTRRSDSPPPTSKGHGRVRQQQDDWRWYLTPEENCSYASILSHSSQSC